MSRLIPPVCVVVAPIRLELGRLPHNASVRGVTLVELLVVIAIIGGVVALLLPAASAGCRNTSC